MSTLFIERSIIAKRQQEVAEITAKHSNKQFGHPYAIIREIRLQAIRHKFERTFAAN